VLIVFYEFIGSNQGWSLTLFFSGFITLVSVPIGLALKEKSKRAEVKKPFN